MMNRNPQKTHAFFWRLNLSEHPIEPAPAIVILWIGLALLSLILLTFDLIIIGRESVRMFQLHQQKSRYQKLARNELDRIKRLQETIKKLDTPRFRDECAFLKEQVEARLFSWSRLLNDLENVLPPGMRIVSITPTIDRTTGRPGVISLSAEAQGLENFTLTVSSFYKSGRFDRVNIIRESPQPDSNLIRYEFTVRYKPESQERPAGEKGS